MELATTSLARFWRKNARLVCLGHSNRTNREYHLFVPRSGIVLAWGSEDELRALAEEYGWDVNDNLIRGESKDPEWVEREGAQVTLKPKQHALPSEKVIEDHWASSPGYQNRIREAKTRREQDA